MLSAVNGRTEWAACHGGITPRIDANMSPDHPVRGQQDNFTVLGISQELSIKMTTFT